MSGPGAPTTGGSLSMLDDDELDLIDPSSNGVGGSALQQTYNVFVGDLDPSVTEEDLYQAFLPLGEIDSVHLMRPRRGSENRGFGFVHFLNKSSQEKSLKPPWSTTVIRGVPCCTRVAEGLHRSKRALYLTNISTSAPTDPVALGRALTSVYQIPVSEVKQSHPTCWKVSFQTHVLSASAFRRYSQLPFFGEKTFQNIMTSG